MSSLEVSVRLNPSFDEWYGARTVVEEELKAIAKALDRIRISSQLQDAFTGHLLAVHRQRCEACPLTREPGLSGAGGGLEKEAPTDIPTRAAAAHTPMKQKTFVSCVSTFPQTTDMNGLQMHAQGKVDDNNDDTSETSFPSSVTCHMEDEESQAYVNRTLEKPSTEKDGQLHLEGMNKVSDQPIKHERDSQGHCDFDMACSSSEAMSYQGPMEEIPCNRSDRELHLEGMNKVSDQPIKHEKDSQGHCDFDMAGSSSEAMSYQGPMKEIPLDRSDGQLHLEGMNKVSDQPIKHERDSQGYCDFDMAGSSSEAMCYQGPMEEIPCHRSDGQLHLEGMNKVPDQLLRHERDSQDHCDFDMAGSSSDAMFHQGPLEENPLDRSDGTNNCDVLSQEGVFKDPCLDSCKKVQKTSKTDDQTNHASSSLNCDVLSKEVSADQCIAGLDSYKKVEKNPGSDDGTNNASSSLNCDVLTEEVSADHCLAGLDSDKNVEKTSVTNGNIKFQCSHCSKRYSCINEYKKHRSTHTCQKPIQSANKSSVEVHLRTHTMEKSYKCDCCTYTCATKQHLKTHMRVHPGEKPHECSLCGKRFTRSSALKIHMRSHSGEKPYSCDICDYRCSQKAYLKRHMKVHTGEKPHKCSLCGKRFLQTSKLKFHMRTHSGEKPYSCDICDYRCSQKRYLTLHMGVHTGEKPHECCLCGKRFKRSSHLKIHMRTHSGEKPYSCDICDYRCSRKDRLQIHMRVHTGEEPYRCSLCGKRFRQLCNLKSHMMMHN